MKNGKPFIDRDKLYGLIEEKVPTGSDLDVILNKALKFKGLNLKETAALLRVQDVNGIHKIMEAAKVVKGTYLWKNALSFFAPIYTGNVCVNNCLYCAFRSDNKTLKRKILTMPENRQGNLVSSQRRAQEDPADLW